MRRIVSSSNICLEDDSPYRLSKDLSWHQNTIRHDAGVPLAISSRRAHKVAAKAKIFGLSIELAIATLTSSKLRIVVMDILVRS